MLRDHVGAFKAAACHHYSRSADPEMVELQACKRAIQLAAEVNVRRLHLESDNSTVVAMTNNSEKNLSAVGPHVEEIVRISL